MQKHTQTGISIWAAASWFDQSSCSSWVFKSLLPPAGDSGTVTCVECVSLISRCLFLYRIWWTGGSPWLGRSATLERNTMHGFTSQLTDQSDCLETPSWRPAPRLPGNAEDSLLHLFISLKRNVFGYSMYMVGMMLIQSQMCIQFYRLANKSGMIFTAHAHMLSSKRSNAVFQFFSCTVVVLLQETC